MQHIQLFSSLEDVSNFNIRSKHAKIDRERYWIELLVRENRWIHHSLYTINIIVFSYQDSYLLFLDIGQCVFFHMDALKLFISKYWLRSCQEKLRCYRKYLVNWNSMLRDFFTTKWWLSSPQVSRSRMLCMSVWGCCCAKSVSLWGRTSVIGCFLRYHTNSERSLGGDETV